MHVFSIGRSQPLYYQCVMRLFCQTNFSVAAERSEAAPSSLYYKGVTSCFFNKFLDDHLHNCCDSKMLRFVLNFEFWSFEFVSDFGFSASDLVAAERSEAAPRPLWPILLSNSIQSATSQSPSQPSQRSWPRGRGGCCVKAEFLRLPPIAKSVPTEAEGSQSGPLLRACEKIPVCLSFRAGVAGQIAGWWYKRGHEHGRHNSAIVKEWE